MKRLHDRVVDALLLAIMPIAGGMVVQGVVRGDDPGCINQKCKETYSIFWCGLGTGVIYQNLDCLVCDGIGRCIGGSPAECLDSDIEQYFGTVSPTLLCDCVNAPANGAVEASPGAYGGDWIDSNRL